MHRLVVFSRGTGRDFIRCFFPLVSKMSGRARWTLLALFLLASEFHCLEKDLVVVVLSQPEGYHAAHARLLRDKIADEAAALGKDLPRTVLSHELRINGSWTVFPLLERLGHDHPDAKWFFFCLDNTGVRLATLIKVLSSLAEDKELWVGHALYDRRPTIIHHFADHSKRFKYPNIASGFAMTGPLLKHLSERIAEDDEVADFSIDASYELATFVFDGGKGVRFSHVPEFCVVSSADCATYPRFFHPCSDPVPREKIFVAVKTCSKNHAERLPVIMKTWMKHVVNFGLFSNESDSSLPNVHVVPHTERGHCAKTRAILRESRKIMEKNRQDWLVIVDDDTILSMGRLARLLTCYNPANPVALGERYGFRVRQRNPNEGYDFLTGGAGVVLSRPLVEKIVDSKWCDCPASTAPDDMYLFGFCLKMIGTSVTHSPLFHQARPSDYAMAYLASQEPVSFHKFWLVDPVEVYDHWFAEADRSLPSTTQRHTEL